MSPFLFVTVVTFCLMAQRLADMYTGSRYVCPTCGARRANAHADNCPWSRLPHE